MGMKPPILYVSSRVARSRKGATKMMPAKPACDFGRGEMCFMSEGRSTDDGSAK